MRVGHGSARFEAVPGEPMGGYADRADGVRDVLDPLEVHVVTFADDGHRFALVVADLICVNTDVVARIRAVLRDLGVQSCWVAATHTHASPEAGCHPGGDVTPRHVGDRLVAAAVAATRSATASERPAGLRATRVLVPGLAGRRNVVDPPPMDIPVDAIAVTAGTDVVGLVVVSPVHPTVFPSDNNHVSADLNGGIRRGLSTSDRWVVAATGAAGDISTRHTRRGRGLAEADRLGALVADRLGPPPYGDVPWRAGPAAAVRPPVSRRVRLQPKQPAELDASLRHTTQLEVGDERLRRVLRQGLRIAEEQAAHPRTEPYEVEVAAVDLDGIVVVAIPGELFLDLGEAIRAAAADQGYDVVVLGYTNGYLGYLPTRDMPPCYETYASPVSSGSGEILAEAALGVAIEAARGRDHPRGTNA